MLAVDHLELNIFSKNDKLYSDVTVLLVVC